MVAKLFFSYSHKDEALRDRLEVHLAMLKREGLLETWHDRRITAGSDLDPAIRGELNKADVVLFLVSPDFLASNYCYEEEAANALQRHEQGLARVIPVILRPCEWHQAPFGRLLATPEDGKPITKWPDQDDAFLNITRAIRRAVQELGKDNNIKSAPITKTHPLSTSEPTKAFSPRSSNMRVTKEFTQRDRADFIDETFDFILKYFEESLEELEKRNSNIDTRFRRIDANRFTGVIYRGEKQVSACTIFRGGQMGGATQIYYSANEDASTSGYNESASLEYDEQSLFMKPMGMSHIHTRQNYENAKLSAEGTAEMFWSILMEPLQRTM